LGQLHHDIGTWRGDILMFYRDVSLTDIFSHSLNTTDRIILYTYIKTANNLFNVV